jgi:hypothetical protein
MSKEYRSAEILSHAASTVPSVSPQLPKSLLTWMIPPSIPKHSAQ